MKIKICGITGPADAVMVAEAGADWIGLNFHPASPRAIDEATAREILAALPSPVEAVGVFVNRPPADVAAVAARVGLRIVQLHGDEPVEDLLALGHLRVVKRSGSATRPTSRRSWPMPEAPPIGAGPWKPCSSTRASLGNSAATGRAIADGLLDLLPALVPAPAAADPGRRPHPRERRRPDRQGPAVDGGVAGGVETAPGRKDGDRGVELPPGRPLAFKPP